MPSEARGEQALPERIGRFEIIGRLGQGGMGQVLRARDPSLGREVALKLLHADVDPTRAPLHAEVARQRLLREAQAMARLDHPNVIGVHEVGEDDGRVFLVMDKVSGATMTGWLAAAPRGWREVVRVFEQVGAGLAAAHDAGLIHRDVKPDNVLVGDDGRVRVTDFGLVGVDGVAALPATAATSGVDPTSATSESLPPPLTHEGALVGTPGYMAPEQVRGGAADARSDQFALAVALYEALFGRAPFAGDGYRARMLAVLDGQVVPPPADTDVPRAVVDVVLRGLAHDAAARWPDVRALVAALTEAAAAPPSPSPVPSAPAVAAPPRRPRRRWAVAAAVLALGGGAIAWRVAGRRASGPTWPLPATAVETLVATGRCDAAPVAVDDRTLVYLHRDRAGADLRVRDLVTGADRALTTTPDVEELSPQPALGERAVVAIPRALTASGAGPARIDVDTGAVTPLPGGWAIAFGPGAVSANGALYYTVGSANQLMELRAGVATERASFPAGIGSISLDPSGRTVAVLTDAACLIDLQVRGEPRCLSDLDAPYGRLGLDDRGHLYYAGLAGLRRRDLATGEDVVLLADRGANGGLAVSASGDELYFSECQPFMEITDLGDGRVVHAESLTRATRNRQAAWVFVRETPSASLLAYLDPDGLLHVLTSAADGAATDPALEPVGDRIAFSLVGPRPGLYLATGRTHRPLRKLSDDPLASPVWIDDGHVAGTLLHDDGLHYVHVLDVETGEHRQALPAARITVDRQPDGDVVLLTSDDRSRLFLWEPASGREREVALPDDVARRMFLDADLGPGARTVDVRVGPEVWTVPIAPPGPATRRFVTPGQKGLWGYELDEAGRSYALLGEDRGDLYRVKLPR